MFLSLFRFIIALLLAPIACGQPQANNSPATSRPMLPEPAASTQLFRLSASPCSPKGYPMTIQFGAFVRPDGKTMPVPSGHALNGSWGRSSIAWAVGDELQPIPVSLEILYFSYLEDTFYEGKFPLPQQKMHDLLTQGFWKMDKQQQVTYDEFTVCVLPKGEVVVWLTGAGQQVLIGRFQGTKSSADFHRFYPKSDRAAMFKEEVADAPPAVQAQVRAGTLSTKQWDEYMQTFTWQVAFNQPVSLYKYVAHYLNAETISSPQTRDVAPYLKALLSPQARPVPRSLWLYLTDEAGHKFVLKADPMDEAETQAAFQTLHRAHPASPITLRVETDKYVKAASIVLESGGQRIALAKSPVRVVALK